MIRCTLPLAFAWVAACTASPSPDGDGDTDTAAPAETAESATDTPATDTPSSDSGDDTPLPDTAPPEATGPRCVIGAGTTAFEPVAAGASFDVEKGIQGGWHTFASVVCDEVRAGSASDVLDRTNPLVDFAVRDASGTLLAGYENLPRPMARDGRAALIHEILVFRGGTFEEAIDRDAVITVDLLDADGVNVHAELPVRLVAWPGYVPPGPVDTAAFNP
jgi:hypothetical protein